MAVGSASLTAARVVSCLWLLMVSLSVLAVPVLLYTVPYWHEVRAYLQQLGLLQTWLSMAACVALLVMSRKRHAEGEHTWAQGTLLVYVLAGLLTAIVLGYGVLPQFLAKSDSLLAQMQVGLLVLLHWLCAGLTARQVCKRQVAG